MVFSTIPAGGHRSATPRLPQPRQAEAVYRALTLAAMLLLLASLCAF